jgi:hypothetical protein
LLELLLTGLQAKLVESFDCIGGVGVDVYGSVDDSIGANSKDSGQLQPAGKDLAKAFLGRTESIEGR